MALGNLAELEFAAGQVEQALRLAGEALEIDARGKNASSLAISYNNIAAYCIALGDLHGASESAREGLRWARQAQYAWGIAVALQHVALLVALGGEVNDARSSSATSMRNTKNSDKSVRARRRGATEKLMATLREHLSETEIEKLAADGAAWSEDQALEPTAFRCILQALASRGIAGKPYAI